MRRGAFLELLANGAWLLWQAAQLSSSVRIRPLRSVGIWVVSSPGIMGCALHTMRFMSVNMSKLALNLCWLLDG